jgi:hypothetical protein
MGPWKWVSRVQRVSFLPEYYTIFLVKILDMKSELAIKVDVEISLVPLGDRCERRAWDVCNRTKVRR